MATETNITEFYKGEYLQITFFAKDRNGAVIETPASQIITLTISDTPEGIPTHTFGTATGEITLTNATTGEFTIYLTAIKMATLLEGRSYYYNIWTGLSANQIVLQALGKLTLKKSVEPV